MATEITPLFLTADAAAKLSRTVDQTERLRERDVDGDDTTDQRIPAKLIDYDAGTGAYTWTRQRYDENGKRIDYMDATGAPVTGDPTSMPAYQVGGASPIPSTSFPFEVMLDKRNTTTSVGPTYEFGVPYAFPAAVVNGTSFTIFGSGGISTQSVTVGTVPGLYQVAFGFAGTTQATAGLDGYWSVVDILPMSAGLATWTHSPAWQKTINIASGEPAGSSVPIMYVSSFGTVITTGALTLVSMLEITSSPDSSAVTMQMNLRGSAASGGFTPRLDVGVVVTRLR